MYAVEAINQNGNIELKKKPRLNKRLKFWLAVGKLNALIDPQKSQFMELGK